MLGGRSQGAKSVRERCSKFQKTPIFALCCLPGRGATVGSCRTKLLWETLKTCKGCTR
ncbi:hypothetical protein F751_5389 [Auxenochlorella protothecoides]|uniref:Uncharacterized protein n=1 Tax=Auxenochlorella protothecoides TaxID=3075 RepID=A0A087SP79_AUXPR|nr:hypothetical protein F751_5389 [Auxenochlorella protothecoides]KFM27533.1 hypothetical protein F751_5389 [Auxenochlorella protothecoides]